MMKICKVEGCNGKHKALGYCDKHYQQHRKYGRILEYTIFDSNEIIEYDDYAEVVLCNRNKEEVGRSPIDLDDIELIKNIKWGLRKDGYAFNRTVGLMHRLITNCPSNMVVDHINGDKLDNRKSNLRICTQAENNRNKNKYKGNRKYKGVFWNKKANKWYSQIRINNKCINLGYFDDELEASIAYDRAAILYYGVYCKTNHSINNYIEYIISLGLDPSDFGVD